jgi:nucleotide-binding universal stress UspA family protein
MPSGPVLIGYDGSAAAEHAVREAGALLGERPAVVVVVWKAGLGFELIELPTSTTGLPPAALDVRSAIEIDQAMQQRAQRLAQQGTALARESGFDAEGVAIADAVDAPVPETLVRVAQERDAQAIVVGAHGHGRLEALVGSTTRDVIRHAPCPVVVVRAAEPSRG